MKSLAVVISALLLITCGLAAVAPSAGAQQASLAKKKCKKAGGHHHGKKRRCKKPPKKTPEANPGGTVETPGTSSPAPKQETTPPKEEPPVVKDKDGDGVLDADDNCPAVANPDQADADADGYGDACDPCPSTSDPDGYCPATVYDVNEGKLPTDAKFKFSNLLVTALTPAGDTGWVGVEPGDTTYSGSPAFSGLEVDFLSASPSPGPGSRIDVSGTVESTGGGWLLEAETVTVTSTGETPTSNVVSAEEFANPADAAELNGVLVRVSELSLISSSGTRWSMAGNPAGMLVIGNRLIGSLPTYPGGEVSITGIADTLASEDLLPRTNADIVPEA